jgi:DNA-binding response OmpR family regulator
MKKNILIVDDDKAILECTKLLLEYSGFQVETTCDGFSLNLYIRGTIPDMILLDYRMPKKDGCMIIKELKDDNKTKNIPILVISASNDIKEKVVEAGADDFLEKPFSIDVLVSKMEKYL